MMASVVKKLEAFVSFDWGDQHIENGLTGLAEERQLVAELDGNLATSITQIYQVRNKVLAPSGTFSVDLESAIVNHWGESLSAFTSIALFFLKNTSDLFELTPPPAQTFSVAGIAFVVSTIGAGAWSGMYNGGVNDDLLIPVKGLLFTGGNDLGRAVGGGSGGKFDIVNQSGTESAQFDLVIAGSHL